MSKVYAIPGVTKDASELLAALFCNPGRACFVPRSLKPEHFLLPAHAEVFRTLQVLWANEHPRPDSVAVFAAANGRISRNDLADILCSLGSTKPAAIREMSARVIYAFQRREIAEMGRWAIAQCEDLASDMDAVHACMREHLAEIRAASADLEVPL